MPVLFGLCEPAQEGAISPNVMFDDQHDNQIVHDSDFQLTDHPRPLPRIIWALSSCNFTTQALEVS